MCVSMYICENESVSVCVLVYISVKMKKVCVYVLVCISVKMNQYVCAC